MHTQVGAEVRWLGSWIGLWSEIAVDSASKGYANG